jgi:hypothetical protein
VSYIDPQSIPGLIFPIAAEGMEYVADKLGGIPQVARAVVKRGFNLTGNTISTTVDFVQEYDESGNLGYAAEVAGVKLAWGLTLEASLATVTGVIVGSTAPVWVSTAVAVGGILVTASIVDNSSTYLMSAINDPSQALKDLGEKINYIWNKSAAVANDCCIDYKLYS